ncbi:MAG: CoA transferase [Sulfurifustis sp.]
MSREPVPLTGRRIVTIALNVPGPMAAQRLHDLGAAVIKVEPPEGDPLSRSSPDWYAELANGMAVECCDLKTTAGRERMYAWLADTDLLLTSQRPAALSRIGLAWDELHARFPRLCQVAIVGYPSPDAHIAGHDLTYLAANDLLDPPTLPPTLFADVAGSERAVSAALAILLERERTGKAQYAEVALSDAVKRMALPRKAGLTLSGRILGGAHPGYNLYRTRDGWVAVATLEPHFYQRLCRELDVTDPSYERFAERFAAATCAHWSQFAEKHDLPIYSMPNESGNFSE